MIREWGDSVFFIILLIIMGAALLATQIDVENLEAKVKAGQFIQIGEMQYQCGAI